MRRRGTLGWADLNRLTARATDWPVREVIAAALAVLATGAWAALLFLLEPS